MLLLKGNAIISQLLYCQLFSTSKRRENKRERDTEIGGGVVRERGWAGEKVMRVSKRNNADLITAHYTLQNNFAKSVILFYDVII